MSKKKLINGGGDMEAPEEESEEEEGDAEDAMAAHPGVLYFSLVTIAILCFVFGVWMVFFPQANSGLLEFWVSLCAGNALFLCGLFLLTNVQVIISWIRMRHEMVVFRENNEEFERHIIDEEATVAKLKKSKDALARINQEFGGDVKRASAEHEKLKAATRTSLGNSCRAICKVYTDKDRDRLIDAGEEMDNTLELLASIFGGFVSDWPEREEKVRDGLIDHGKYTSAGGVKQNVFADVIQCAIELDMGQITPRVVQIMDAAAL